MVMEGKEAMYALKRPREEKSWKVAHRLRWAVKRRGEGAVLLLGSVVLGGGCQEPVERLLRIQCVTGAAELGVPDDSSWVRVLRYAAREAEIWVMDWVIEDWEGPVQEMVDWTMVSSGAWVKFESPVQVIRTGAMAVAVQWSGE